MLVAVRQLTVNDEICKEFADDGGVLAVAAVLDAGAWLRTPAVVRAALGALRQMSSSDSVKTLLAERVGIEKVDGRGGGTRLAQRDGVGSWEGRKGLCGKGVLRPIPAPLKSRPPSPSFPCDPASTMNNTPLIIT